MYFCTLQGELNKYLRPEKALPFPAPSSGLCFHSLTSWPLLHHRYHLSHTHCLFDLQSHRLIGSSSLSFCFQVGHLTVIRHRGVPDLLEHSCQGQASFLEKLAGKTNGRPLDLFANHQVAQRIPNRDHGFFLLNMSLSLFVCQASPEARLCN